MTSKTLMKKFSLLLKKNSIDNKHIMGDGPSPVQPTIMEMVVNLGSLRTTQSKVMNCKGHRTQTSLSVSSIILQVLTT